MLSSSCPRVSNTLVATWSCTLEKRGFGRESFWSRPIHPPLSRLLGPTEVAKILLCKLNHVLYEIYMYCNCCGPFVSSTCLISVPRTLFAIERPWNDSTDYQVLSLSCSLWAGGDKGARTGLNSDGSATLPLSIRPWGARPHILLKPRFKFELHVSSGWLRSAPSQLWGGTACQSHHGIGEGQAGGASPATFSPGQAARLLLLPLL